MNGRIGSPARLAFKEDAILYRATSECRAEFRSKSRRALSQGKTAIRGPLHYILARTVNLSRPKDWTFCGPCGGSGMAGSSNKGAIF